MKLVLTSSLIEGNQEAVALTVYSVWVYLYAAVTALPDR